MGSSFAWLHALEVNDTLSGGLVLRVVEAVEFVLRFVEPVLGSFQSPLHLRFADRGHRVASDRLDVDRLDRFQRRADGRLDLLGVLAGAAKLGGSGRRSPALRDRSRPCASAISRRNSSLLIRASFIASRTLRWISSRLIRLISSLAWASDLRTSAFSAGVRSFHFFVSPFIVTLPSLMLRLDRLWTGATGATGAGAALPLGNRRHGGDRSGGRRPRTASGYRHIQSPAWRSAAARLRSLRGPSSGRSIGGRRWDC